MFIKTKKNALKPFKNGWILSESALTRYITFSILYAAQGIPEGITFFAIPAWLAMNGKSPSYIASYVAVIGIPWSFKILIAPIMDRFTFLPMGRKRPWVILGQMGLIISFLSIGFVNNPLNNLQGLMIAGFCISFFGAFQDVATDGMAVDLVPSKQQARANGLMWGTKIIGTSASLAIGTSLLNSIGFHKTINSLAIVVFLIMLVPLYCRERPGEKWMPWSLGEASKATKSIQLSNWKTIFKNLTKVVILPSSLILSISSFIIGIMYGLIDTLLPIFTVQELGWTNTKFSQVFSVMTILGGLLGMFVGGAMVDFLGKLKMMSLYLIFLAILIIGFGIFPSLWHHKAMIYGFILSYYTGYTFLCISIFATAMHLCWKTVAATQFTLYMALSNMGRASGSGLLGPLKNNLSWEQVFFVTALAPLIMLFMIRYINFLKHKKSIKAFVKISPITHDSN